MAKIIKNQSIVEDDWKYLADDAAAEGERFIVSLTRWNAERAELVELGVELGVQIAPDEQIDDLLADLGSLSLIALEFPAFKDGRNYSKSRMLRERHGYTGELRAIGNILRDQIFYLSRCGMNAMELEEGKDLDDALNAFNEFSVTYQTAADRRLPVYRDH